MTELSDTGYALLASCVSDNGTGGGLVAIDRDRVERVDRFSSTGLYMVDNRLLRVLRDEDRPSTVGELVVYGPWGVERYLRLDAAQETHDVAWDGTSFIVVSTATNTILWIAPSGEVVRSWTAPGEGDAGHLNNLLIKDGDLYVAGFSKRRMHRAWSRQLRAPDGFVLNIDTGQDVLTGLTCPHNPRFFDGEWTVCNSLTNEVLRFDPHGTEITRRLQLNGFTRGMAVRDDVVFVGESARRQDRSSGAHAAVAVVDRKTWALVDRIPLPFDEIYDLVLVPAQLLDAVRQGFAGPEEQRVEEPNFSLFRSVGVEEEPEWAFSDPLPPEACTVRVEFDAPTFLRSGQQVGVPCTVENRGQRSLVSAAPNPITVAYRWIRQGAQEDLIEIDHYHLPQTLRPGKRVKFILKITAPMEEGEFLLRVTLVQEHVRWFDETDSSNACTRLVWIEPPDRSVFPESTVKNGAESAVDGEIMTAAKDSDVPAI